MALMTKAEYARRCKVAKSTVTRWVQSGRIQLEPNGRIDAAAADAMRGLTECELPAQAAHKAQIELEREPSAAPEPLEISAVAHRLKVAMMREREAKAEAAALELDLRVRQLVERAEVEHVLADFGAVLRGLAEGLADRVTPVVCGRRGDAAAIHSDIEGAARDLLAELAAHMERKGLE